jgi:pyruvate/2-oxoglutarate dehydrogenase complex dihydrolipoamide acyltransferase (E2) component
MRIAIKVPVLPFSAATAEVGHWYRKIGEVIARDEVLVELRVRGHLLPVLATQAGVIKQILFQQNDQAAAGEILAYLETGLPNLVWNSEQGLVLESYHAEGITAGMEYDLRQLLRSKTKFGNGFGSGLALPQFPNETPNYGQGRGMGASAHSQFKSHPSLQSPQFSGNFKDPRVNTVPSTPEAQRAPQNVLALSPKPNLAPGAPTLAPKGG